MRHLRAAKKKGIQQSVLSCALEGGVLLVAFGTVGLGFWYGTTLVYSEAYTGGVIIQVQESRTTYMSLATLFIKPALPFVPYKYNVTVTNC